jgi:hypothetical protein
MIQEVVKRVIKRVMEQIFVGDIGIREYPVNPSGYQSVFCRTFSYECYMLVTAKVKILG